MRTSLSIHASLALALFSACATGCHSSNSDNGSDLATGDDLSTGGGGGGGGGDMAGSSDLAGSDGGVVLGGRLWPMVLNRSWTYSEAVVGTGMPCASGPTSVETVTAEKITAAKNDYTVQFHCGNAPFHFVQLAADGTTHLVIGASDTLYLGVPEVDGTPWSRGATPMKWMSVGMQTVPAGTFSDCWKAQDTGIATHYEIYCRDVGLIKDSVVDGAGNGYASTLTAKNF